MSKLFDTLEQIRKNEATGAPQPGQVPQKKSAKRKIRWAAITPVFLLITTVLIYVLVPNLTGYLPQQITTIFMDDNKQTSTLPPQLQQQATEQKNTPSASITKRELPPLPDQTSQTKSPAQMTPPQTSVSIAQTTTLNFTELNNQGARLIRQEQYWQGIHILNRAISLQPKRIEPYINMGVALSELGLYGPATRYFQKAKQIDPGHKALAANFDLLHQAGLMENIQ